MDELPTVMLRNRQAWDLSTHSTHNMYLLNSWVGWARALVCWPMDLRAPGERGPAVRVSWPNPGSSALTRAGPPHGYGSEPNHADTLTPLGASRLLALP